MFYFFDGEISYVIGTKIKMSLILLLYETSCYKKKWSKIKQLKYLTYWSSNTTHICVWENKTKFLSKKENKTKL